MNIYDFINTRRISIIKNIFSKWKYTRPIFLILFLLLIAVLVYQAPRYLQYAEKPVKSDAVVLFLGPEINEKLGDVKAYLNDGYVRYLVIPINQEVFIPLSPDARHLEKWLTEMVSASGQINNYPAYYENTHIEVLEARRLMKTNSIRSAIFVSAPNHMRRIKIITREVFEDPTIKITFVPTSFNSTFQERAKYAFSNLKSVGQEYIKIIWFLIYFHFEGIS